MGEISVIVCTAVLVICYLFSFVLRWSGTSIVAFIQRSQHCDIGLRKNVGTKKRSTRMVVTTQIFVVSWDRRSTATRKNTTAVPPCTKLPFHLAYLPIPLPYHTGPLDCTMVLTPKKIGIHTFSNKQVVTGKIYDFFVFQNHRRKKTKKNCDTKKKKRSKPDPKTNKHKQQKKTCSISSILAST